MKTWVSSDHHFGHKNIIKFADSGGNIHRKFETNEEHDNFIITQHNSVVAQEDKVYLLGDFAISKKYISLAQRMNGRKTLVLGNHDIFNTKEYTPYFDNIRAYRVLNVGTTDKRIILSHIPIAQECMNRFCCNVHGHLHNNEMQDKVKYKNVSMEKLDNYKPVDLQTIIDAYL